jgi:hypothetical protein
MILTLYACKYRVCKTFHLTILTRKTLQDQSVSPLANLRRSRVEPCAVRLSPLEIAGLPGKTALMCGRYTPTSELKKVADRFGAPMPGDEWAPKS